MREFLLKTFQLLVDIQPQYDKMSHLFYGFLFYYLLRVFFKRKLSNIIFFSIVLLKEIIDCFVMNKIFDVMDLYYSMIPFLMINVLLKFKKNDT